MSEPRTPSASTIQDQGYVVRAIEGDQEAFGLLLKKYKEPIKHHVQRMVRDRVVVEDLVQEVFIKAFNSITSYSSQFAFSTWLYKIATNHSIDYLRKRKLNTMSINQPLSTRDGEMEFVLEDKTLTYRPDQHVVNDQRNEIIQDAIDQLPEKYHRVIVMRHQKEMSYDEIAQALELPLGTVKAHIFRAREMLYRHLREKRESL